MHSQGYSVKIGLIQLHSQKMEAATTLCTLYKCGFLLTTALENYSSVQDKADSWNSIWLTSVKLKVLLEVELMTTVYVAIPHQHQIWHWVLLVVVTKMHVNLSLCPCQYK